MSIGKRVGNRRYTIPAAGSCSGREVNEIRQRLLMAQASRSAIGWERQQRDGYDPFAKPSRKGRFLRIATLVHG